ncbi:MAG TPA: hypothetical protein VMY79_02855 [Dehalococcoidia bacterium]|nr:hypothetical protein [Dehalococcoidia bacterium]
MILTLRVNIKALKERWKEDRKEYMLDTLALCGLDDNLLDEISHGQWGMRKRLIGRKIKIGKRGLE